MFDPVSFSVHLALCCCAVALASCVGSCRRTAVWLAVLLLANFVFCALAYTPFAPKYALAAVGIDVSSKHLWMLADASYGSLCVLAFRRWWGWALWATACVQTGTHIAYQFDAFGPIAYSDWLQTVLHAQLAVFFLAGGPGARNILRLAADRLGHYCVALATKVSAARS